MCSIRVRSRLIFFYTYGVSYKDTSICCVCAHLTAGQKGFEQRIKDIIEISAKTRFMAHHTPTIESHDYQFWFGDFNFRIDMPHFEVMRWLDLLFFSLSLLIFFHSVRTNELKELLLHDQLMKAREMGLAFADFHEGTITFNPTYKFDVGSYQNLSVELPRGPEKRAITYTSIRHEYI